MSDHSKRTRSQLLISEEFGEVHLGISPLRAARLERRRNIHTDPLAGSSEATPPSVEAGGDESDDELLLSPHKIRPPKRQPLSQQPESPSRTDHERECKRFKQGHNDGEYPAWVGISTCDLPMTGWQSSLNSQLPRQGDPTGHLTSLPSTRNCSLARAVNTLGSPRHNGHTRFPSTRLPSVVEILGNLCPRLGKHLLSLCRMRCVPRACHALSDPQPMPWLLIMMLVQSYRKSLNAIRVLKDRIHHPR